MPAQNEYSIIEKKTIGTVEIDPRNAKTATRNQGSQQSHRKVKGEKNKPPKSPRKLNRAGSIEASYTRLTESEER